MWKNEVITRLFLLHQVLLEALEPYPVLLNTAKKTSQIVSRTHQQFQNNPIYRLFYEFQKQRQVVNSYIQIAKERWNNVSLRKMITSMTKNMEFVMAAVMRGDFDVIWQINLRENSRIS